MTAGTLSSGSCEAGQSHLGGPRFNCVKIRCLLQILLCCGAIAGRQCNLASMPQDLGIANPAPQRIFDSPASLLIPAVHVKCPGVGIERIDILPASEFPLSDLQRAGRPMCIVRVIE